MEEFQKINKLVYSGLSLDLINAMRQLSTKPQYTGFDTLIRMTKQIKNDSLIESILKGIDARNKYFNNSNDFATAITNQAKAMQSAIKGISNSFQDLAINQKLLSEKLLLTCNSQISLLSSFGALSKSIKPNIYSNFNALSVTMETFSESYLDLSIKSKEWENLDIFQETTDKIKIVTDELVAKNKAITKKDLDDFKIEIIEELSSALSKLKNNKIINLIFKIIPIISLVFAINSRTISKRDLTNREVLEQTKDEIANLKTDIKNEVLKRFEKIQRIYVAVRDVNLREFPSVKSQSLGIVKNGQEIIVLDIHAKWLFINYIDSTNNDTISGYVYKLYFQPINK